tara:strand:- start:232 stop:870 length:639 start_codon:yes stop_codon:yes gene_type:complete
MASLIKIIATVFIVSSCSVDIFPRFNKDLTYVSSINNHEFIDSTTNLKLSFLTLQLNNYDEFMAVLVSTNEGIMRWKSSGNISLSTKHGKLIKINGIDRDFEIIGYKGISFNNEINSALLRFSNPDSGFLRIHFEYELVKKGLFKKSINEQQYEYSLYKEKFTVPLISWKGENFYWLDANGIVFKSKQSISPFGDKIEISAQKKTATSVAVL